VDTEELRGVETTHYRAVVDPALLAKQVAGAQAPQAQSLFGQVTTRAGLADVPVDVWLDSNGLVRKLSLAFSAAEASTSQSGSVTMSFELWDYGKAVAIDVPPASQVAAASALRG
jgi:hypothetical protein